MNERAGEQGLTTVAGLEALLREQAERRIGEISPVEQSDLDSMTPELMRQTLHELRVHQIELQMQNEELRRAHLELDASRSRYFDLYDLAPVSYCTISEHGLILEANIAAATLFGISRSQLVGQRFIRHVMKDWQDAYFLYSKRLFESGESQTIELQLLKAGSATAWVNVSGAMAQEATGATVLRLILSDVTHAKVMAVAMQSSEARYRTLVDWSPDAIVVQRDGKIVYANPATAIMFGAVTESELIGGQLLDRVHPDFRSIFSVRANNVSGMSTGISPVFEEIFLKLDGTPINVEVQNISTIYDGTVAVQVTVRDITDRKNAERGLRELDERYRNLFDSIDEGFCVIERIERKGSEPLDFRYLEVNPAFAKQSGLFDVVGRTFREVLPDEPDEWLSICDNVCRTGIPIRFEREFVSRKRVLELYAFRIGNTDSGKIAVIFHDTTKRRKNELERLRLSRELLGKNLEFEGARTLAEQANRAKSAFLSSMSHELRTPLNAILGFGQLLQSGTPAPTVGQQQQVEQILKAGWYLLELINEILDLTLIESGKLSLTLEPVSLVTVIRECEAMIAPQARLRGIRTNFPELAIQFCVKADRRRIKQVFLNLLSNAIKYNRPGGNVEVRLEETDAYRVRVSVLDAGDGLNDWQIEHLFEPFNRLGREANTEEGTGIGLVMTKRLMELMGGEIGVKSKVGVGSEFWIEMDIVPPDLLTPSPLWLTPVDADADAGVTVEGAIYTVVYMEDDEATLMLVDHVIAQHQNFRLLTARDAMSGIDLVRTCRPDIILMDVNLPGVNGFDALRIVQTDPALATIPVVAISANAFPEDISQGLAAGFFRYITKPFEIDEFMLVLEVAGKFARSASHIEQ